MAILRQGGLEIQLEEVDGLWVKLAIPDNLVQAMQALPAKACVEFLLRASIQYRLSSEQFEFVIMNMSADQWIAAGNIMNKRYQVWQRILLVAETNPNLWGKVLEYVVHVKLLDSEGLNFVLTHIHRTELPHVVRKYFWEYVAKVCRDEFRHGELRLKPDEISLLQASMAACVAEKPLYPAHDVVWERIAIALVLNHRPALKSLWLQVLAREAACDESDFGEDDGRDIRLEKLFRQAVVHLPECTDEFASFCVDSLVQRGRKFMAANLARNLTLENRAKSLYVEVRGVKLKKDGVLSVFDNCRIADCSYGAGEYEAAYGYYLVAENKEGMFKAAWEFDRSLAVTIAESIAQAVLAGHSIAWGTALKIAQQAGIAQIQPLYEKVVGMHEAAVDLDRALALAREFNDEERVTRYELLMSALPAHK